jgi:hypothetical protein
MGKHLHSPAVLVRVPITGPTGYGTWKSIPRMEGKGVGSSLSKVES